MKANDVKSREALVDNGGEAAAAKTINVDDLVRLDGPNGAVLWARVIDVEGKPKTTWLTLQIPGLFQTMNLRPRHDDEFAVRRADR